MTKEAFALVAGVLVLALFAAGVLAWRARVRRDADIPAPMSWSQGVTPTLVVDALYVATTRAGRPYDRVVAHGLGFRGRTLIEFDATGIQLDPERTRVRIPAISMTSVERATWTIDRVVEPGGLLVLRHVLGTGSPGATEVDTYFRVIGDDRPVLAALQTLVHGRAWKPDAPE